MRLENVMMSSKQDPGHPTITVECKKKMSHTPQQPRPKSDSLTGYGVYTPLRVLTVRCLGFPFAVPGQGETSRVDREGDLEIRVKSETYDTIFTTIVDSSSSRKRGRCRQGTY